jgi:hypothetical protein
LHRSVQKVCFLKEGHSTSSLSFTLVPYFILPPV